jgi:hypothetical protein
VPYLKQSDPGVLATGVADWVHTPGPTEVICIHDAYSPIATSWHATPSASPARA